ncbi:MAG: hypothetical protein KDA22_11475, partial [Phycisphaerales bacterium]|nr:hypothetical protein [Phycisphaerales bacterium]
VDRYATSGRVDEIRLMLAMLYTRLLHDPDKAKERLASVRRTGLDPSQRDFADRLLEELPA